MTIFSEVLKSKRIVITRVQGPLSVEDLEAKQLELKNNPDFDPSFNHLFDMSGVTRMEDVSAAVVKRIAQIRIFSPDSRRAVVAPDDLTYGYSRMYEVFSKANDSNLAVVRNEEQAMDWLEEVIENNPAG